MRIDLDLPIIAYKEMCSKRRHSRNKNATKFIREGDLATKIRYRNYTGCPAAIMFESREGPDSVVVFTLLSEDDNTNSELLKGDYFIEEEKPDAYFVFENVRLTGSPLYKKQLAYECNVIVDHDDTPFAAYYVSSLRRHMEVEFGKSISLASIDKPIAIFPRRESVKVGHALIIGSRVFTVTEIDDMTNSGIMYCSLTRTFAGKEVEVAVDDEPNGSDTPTAPETAVLYAGVETTMKTNQGYFTATPNVEILMRSGDEVRFVVPFEIYSVRVAVKDVEGNIITKTYDVK